MARTLRTLGQTRLAELDAAWDQAHPDWARRRLQVVRLVAQHELSAAQIAAATGVSRASVFNYLAAFAHGGVAGLLQRGHSGGPKPTVRGKARKQFLVQLRKGKFRRAKEAQAWIKRRTRKSLALSSVY